MSKELAIIENLELVPFFTKGDSVDEILDKIATEARAHVPDVSTAKGRKAITANITEVTKSKTYLEENRKKLADEYKAIPKAIDANGKKVKDFLTALQADLRKPLTDWEEDQARIKAEKLAKQEAEKLVAQIESDHEMALLMDANVDREIAEYKAKVEADRIAREEEMKRQAAETARIEAEQKAAEKIAIAEREKIESEQRYAKAKQDIIDAQVREVQTERDRIAEIEAAQHREEMARWVEYINEAYVINDQIDARAKANRDAEIAAENARLAEVRRQQDLVDQQNREQAAREADLDNRAAKNNAAKDAIIALGFQEAGAKALVKAIAKGLIPNVKISY